MWLAGGDDAGEESKTVAAFLVGAFTLVASALAVIGLGEGDVDRAVVNRSTDTKFAFAAVVIAVCLGSAMSLIKKARGRGICGLVGLLALGVGLMILAQAAIAGRVAKDRPRIAAHIERSSTGMSLKGQVTAEGLKATEYVRVRIIGISTQDRLAEAHIGHQRGSEATASCPDEDTGEAVPKTPSDVTGKGVAGAGEGTESSHAGAGHRAKSCWRQLVYSSRTGALSDGKVNVDLDAPLATGIYERVDVEALLLQKDEANPRKAAAATDLREPRCDKNTTEFGCVTLMIPPGARRPELDARWEYPASSPPMLTITARMGDLAVDDRVLLSVRRELEERKWARVYGASWAPNSGGEVSEKLSIPVSTRRRPVCVIMRTLKGAVQPRRESTEAYGPCHPRSQGMAVQLYAPPRPKLRG
jgi:hypothetical protein